MKELDASAADPLPAPAISTNSDKKDLLIENYLPNLSIIKKLLKKLKSMVKKKYFNYLQM